MNKKMTKMSESHYKTPGALEMAVRDAARNSPQDTGRAIQDFYTGRLIERVFSVDESSFVLKGGRSVLARTIYARRTTDADFLFRGSDLEEAVNELRRLASIDLHDYLRFDYISDSPIAEDQEYRIGRRVRFAAILGGTKAIAEVSVDIVSDIAFNEEAERICVWSSKNRHFAQPDSDRMVTTCSFL